MTTPPNDPRVKAAAAQVEKGARERAAAYGPPPWQPIWKRPRKPKSKKQKEKELQEQRKRLQAAGRRRHIARQSCRPRSRRNRIGSAASRRDARALSRMRHSTTSPG